MNKRQRKYLEKRKAFKNRKNGYEFTSFTLPAPSPTYDSGFIMPMNDEPDYFRNLGMMMPQKAIKMPTKKEMKKAWYGGSRLRKVSPVFFGMQKPWQRKKITWLDKPSMIDEMKPWIGRCSDAYRKMKTMIGMPEDRQGRQVIQRTDAGEFNIPAATDNNPVTITIKKENHSSQ